MNSGTRALLILSITLAACGDYQQPAPAAQTVSATPPTPEQQRKSYCQSVMGQAMMAPTLSGRFGESMSNATAAYNACIAGQPIPLTPAQQRQQNTVNTHCRPDYVGGYNCTSY